jgi:hypothetical protein
LALQTSSILEWQVVTSKWFRHHFTISSNHCVEEASSSAISFDVQEKDNLSDKVEIVLEKREVAFLSPSKISENLNFSTVHLWKFKFSQILLGDKNATYLCSKIISILTFNHLSCHSSSTALGTRELWLNLLDL